MRIECQTTIQAPIAEIYRVSQDYAVRYEWDPFPENIALLHGATEIAKGVCVAVHAKNGLKMDVQFVQVAPPTSAAVKMLTGPIMLKAFAGSWIFKPITANETMARFVYSIETKWWTLPFISERLASWYFSSAIEKRLNGLKAYCERTKN